LTKNLKMKKFYILIIFFILSPITTEAHIVISEIMYNLDGSDVGREWIEVCNTGKEKVNLKDWKLAENGKNHNISFVDDKTDNFLIPSKSCAVVVVNKKEINNFYNDNPNFSGILFYSAFSSLNNSGEKISIKDADLNDIDKVNYSSDWGANGDGNSLQLVKGKWIASIPTMGLLNNLSVQSSTSENKKDKSEITSSLSSSQELDLMKKHISIDAGKDRKVIAGADTLFKALAMGEENTPLKNAHYTWSMGDGSRKNGQSILYTYQYPGDYVVVLGVTSGEYSADDRVIVTALPADISISKVDKRRVLLSLIIILIMN